MTFSWKFPQKFREKISKASGQTVPVTKSNLGLQLVFQEIVVFIRSVRKPKRNCSIRRMEFPKSKDYSFIKWYHFLNTFTQMITPEKIIRFKAFRKKKIHHSLCTSTSNPSSGNFSWLCRATNMVSSLNRCRSSLIWKQWIHLEVIQQ